MIEPDRAARHSDRPTPSPEMPPDAAPDDGQPLRFLLIRTKAGELPWLAQAMAQLMAPVEIIQVVGMANALWRLGQERFDSVLLDVDLNDRRVIRRCREQILDIAAVPVLDLADFACGRARTGGRDPPGQAAGEAAGQAAEDDRRRAARPPDPAPALAAPAQAAAGRPPAQGCRGRLTTAAPTVGPERCGSPRPISRGRARQAPQAAVIPGPWQPVNGAIAVGRALLRAGFASLFDLNIGGFG